MPTPLKRRTVDPAGVADRAIHVASCSAARAVICQPAIIVPVGRGVIGPFRSSPASERGGGGVLRHVALAMTRLVVPAQRVAVAANGAQPAEVAVGATWIKLGSVAAVAAQAAV